MDLFICDFIRDMKIHYIFFVHRISIFNHNHGRSRGCSTWRDVRWSRHKHRLSLICNRSTNDCSGFCTPSKTTALNRTVPALTDH